MDVVILQNKEPGLTCESSFTEMVRVEGANPGLRVCGQHGFLCFSLSLSLRLRLSGQTPALTPWLRGPHHGDTVDIIMTLSPQFPLGGSAFLPEVLEESVNSSPRCWKPWVEKLTINTRHL